MVQYLGMYLRLYVCVRGVFQQGLHLAEQVRWNGCGVWQCIIPSQGRSQVCQGRRHPGVSLTGGGVSHNA